MSCCTLCHPNKAGYVLSNSGTWQFTFVQHSLFTVLYWLPTWLLVLRIIALSIGGVASHCYSCITLSVGGGGTEAASRVYETRWREETAEEGHRPKGHQDEVGWCKIRMFFIPYSTMSLPRRVHESVSVLLASFRHNTTTSYDCPRQNELGVHINVQYTKMVILYALYGVILGVYGHLNILWGKQWPQAVYWSGWCALWVVYQSN